MNLCRRSSLPELGPRCRKRWSKVFVESSDPWWRRHRRSKAVEIDRVEWRRKLSSAETEAIEMTAETDSIAIERIECEMKNLGLGLDWLEKFWVWDEKIWGRKREMRVVKWKIWESKRERKRELNNYNAPSNKFYKENLRRLTHTVATTASKLHFEAVTR